MQPKIERTFFVGRGTCKIAENPAIVQKIWATKLSAIVGFYCPRTSTTKARPRLQRRSWSKMSLLKWISDCFSFFKFQLPNLPCNENGHYTGSITQPHQQQFHSIPRSSNRTKPVPNHSSNSNNNLVPEQNGSRTKHHSHKVEAKRTVEVYPT